MARYVENYMVFYLRRWSNERASGILLSLAIHGGTKHGRVGFMPRIGFPSEGDGGTPHVFFQAKFCTMVATAYGNRGFLRR